MDNVVIVPDRLIGLNKENKTTKSVLKVCNPPTVRFNLTRFSFIDWARPDRGETNVAVREKQTEAEGKVWIS